MKKCKILLQGVAMGDTCYAEIQRPHILAIQRPHILAYNSKMTAASFKKTKIVEGIFSAVAKYISNAVPEPQEIDDTLLPVGFGRNGLQVAIVAQHVDGSHHLYRASRLIRKCHLTTSDEEEQQLLLQMMKRHMDVSHLCGFTW